ncbi:4-hydroxythreonine-4-phosphate dehydrogenase PdxA [Prosthecochloris sp. CIB 2401]|uniref:4-hydroxythreonine-4-phosphate dehydrogenase PdxA n=1 Tax=Prosthecochloris sp. CIB 2401 TaxID=1868325 RepID=UPI00080AA311|nr:4-hydroxythreonine-4-phosphate dehydrogenase PdxA [Prosthecochloris sp. CIB 2401]ANT65356.1 4-hydroxythreonine-4-phosphate dehydrogenase 1 [Prosthecochloris sp. CIB 2401]
MQLTAWSIGDMNGIGPEIILKSFRRISQSGSRPLVTGSFKALDYYNKLLGLDVHLQQVHSPTEACSLPKGILPVLSTKEPCTLPNPGTVDPDSGRIALSAISKAVELCLEGSCSAMVTAPIHKEAIAAAGCHHNGHTGYIARLCGSGSPIMLFHDPVTGLNVALATIHEPLSSVPGLIRDMDMGAFVTRLHQSLQQDFAISNPRIALLGLNPHASDGGVMGTEEQDFLIPAIEQLSEHIDIQGPFAADGFFGARRYTSFDVTLAMYHDQGLLPFKVLAFDTGVNVTLGLPIVRTSPDHGTSFDIAGSGKASPESFTCAAQLADRIALNRNNRRNHP